jgi:hypothetical protein
VATDGGRAAPITWEDPMTADDDEPTGAGVNLP